MRIDRRSSNDERRVLTAMITDPVVLGKVAARWSLVEGGLFASTWANLVAGWCIKYYDRYGKAPNTTIEGMYEHWAEKDNRDKDTVALVERYLATLSEEYERTSENPEYIVDLASRHFRRVSLTKIRDGLEADLDSGDIDAAEERITTAPKIELGGSAAIDVMGDEEAVRTAFENTREPLIIYPGPLGEFFGPHLERNALIAVEGAEKRGKTWWLIDLAWMAMCQRRRVAFFEVGDLTQNQIIVRWGIRAARRPIRPCTVQLPTAINWDGEGVAEVDYKEKTFNEGLIWQDAYRAMRRVTKEKIRSKKSYFRVSTHPADSINVAGIRAILLGWIRDGWVPDVIVIDYADILASPGSGLEGRDAINKTWIQLNGLRQEFHCLVITATQADAASYDTHTLTRKNFSEDKRKMAHVNGMFGLNATIAEKAAGITRLNWLQLRDGRFNESQCIHVAGCLDLGNPAIKSTW